MFRIGMQMYTLREPAAQDLEGTFRAVAEMGYAGAQISGIDAPPERIAEVLKECGLEPAGAHVGLERMETDFDGVIADARTIGYTGIAVPYLGADRRRTAAEWEAVARAMDGLGARMKKEGIQLMYHNHNFEFEPVAGTTGYEIIWSNVDLDNLQPEVDTYWAAFAGDNPAKLLERFAGHMDLVHAKDGRLGVKDPKFEPVGDGDLDWPPILAATAAGGANWLLVEQDTCDGSPFDAARRSLENIRRLLSK